MFTENFTIHLQNFCNNLLHGHLKEWKARSIIMTLVQIPNIKEDDERLKKYISNCLIMEGFHHMDIPKICKFIKENVI